MVEVAWLKLQLGVMPLPPDLPPTIALLLLAATGVYLLPAITAYARRHPQRRAIAEPSP